MKVLKKWGEKIWSLSQVEGDYNSQKIFKLAPLPKKKATRKKTIIVMMKKEDEKSKKVGKKCCMVKYYIWLHYEKKLELEFAKSAKKTR
jgi:hypothetical protein